MCVVCGCADTGQALPVAGTAGGGHSHGHEHGHGHSREHGHVHAEHRHDLHFGTGAARVSVPGLSQERTVRLEADILGANNRVAQQNRRHFASHGVTALNLLSSPGSGKTTLLCATIEALKTRAPSLRTAVIEGDQQTSFDAERIRATGAPAIQINTGKGCHLDAPMVAEAFAQLHHHGHGHDHGDEPGLLLIENVGNLVCPALWDLGEAAKVVVLSVTEGEDKPLKYPDMFAAATLMVLNKIDLLPHLRFDVQRCIEAARRVNPSLQVIQLSAVTGEGMDAWLQWLTHQGSRADQPAAASAPRGDRTELLARAGELKAAAGAARALLRHPGA